MAQGYNQSLVNHNPNQDYDYKKIVYQEITPDQWSQAPCQQTDYSNYWATPDAFQPQKFSQNTKVETKWNDLGWNIAFWINFLITLGIFAYLCTREISTANVSKALLLSDQPKPQPSFTTKQLLTAVGIGAGVGVVLNIVHMAYAFFAPVVYVHAGLIIDLVLSIAAAVYLLFFTKSYYFFIWPGFMLVFALCWYCIARNYIKVSAAILKTSIKVVLRYPAVIGVLLLQGLISLLVTGFFCYIVFLVLATNFSVYIFIYFGLSYLWISLCFGYVAYMTVAGVASTWYFLNDTEFFPAHPTAASFKRAATTSFGSASEAAFILAVIQLLRTLIMLDTSGSSSSWVDLILCCLRCVAMCILNCLESIFGTLNRYALIYCATFGIPYKEGCMRIIESFVTKFIDVLLSSCVISEVCYWTLLAFSVVGAFVGYGIGYGVGGKDSNMSIWSCVFSLVCTLCLFLVFMQPMIVTADTLLVCFSENPEKLETSAAELSEELKRVYGSQLQKKTHGN